MFAHGSGLLFPPCFVIFYFQPRSFTVKKMPPPVFFLCMAAACVARAAEPVAEPAAFTVAPVRLVCSPPLPEGLPQSLLNKLAVGNTPMPAGGDDAKTRYEIFMLATGAGLIAIQPGTLQMAHAKTPGGADIARDYRGLSTATAGALPAVSEDGTFGLFTIHIATDDPAPVLPLDIKGSIRVKTSDKAETATHTAQLDADSEPAQLGPYEVAVSVHRQTLRVKITGPNELFSSLEVESGGEKLASSSSHMFLGGGLNPGNTAVSNISISFNTTAVNADGETTATAIDASTTMQDMVKNFVFASAAEGAGSRTYSFTLPKDAGEATISLTYWTDPLERDLPFEASVFE